MKPQSVLVLLLIAAGLWAQPPKDPFTARQRQFWSFQKVRRPAVPQVKAAGWAANPIDAFLAAKLESKGLTPGPAADRITLLRRASFDLVGLPPAPAEVEAFLADKGPDAFEKVVARLLASPHYGERWSRHWLDLARYAESEGFKSDETRPNAWRYRDYVIEAFNKDKPYDRFVREQIAGDEFWPGDPEARVATAFNRHYPDESNARNLRQRRQEILNDITDTAGSVFLGLTIGCARCHNHKFDPILQADYYRFQAFFANTGADDEIPMWPAEKFREHRARKAVWEEQTRPIRAEMNALLEPARKRIVDELFAKYPAEIQAAILKPAAERSPFESLMSHKAHPYMSIDEETASKRLRGAERKRYDELKAELAKFAHLDPGPLPLGAGIIDLGRSAPPVHVLKVGAWDAPLEEVQPGFLTILDPSPAKIASPEGLESTGRRMALANWLADPENPFTARVMVNRIWHYHFGRGIVGTPSDFGIMGERPSHPELLDWLASEFVSSGWSVKHIHRLIMSSNTYRQSSAFRKEAAAADPGNRLLWSFPRQRLEGEVIRDSALFIAGLLNPKTGGPSVFPELPDGMGASRGGWKLSEDPAERNRRSVYIFVRRNARYPLLEAFDMPDTHETCARRQQTVTAPQALAMLNDRVAIEWAQGFAGRVLESAGADRHAQIETAYRLAYSRPPDAWEKDTVSTFLHKHRSLVAERAVAGEKLALPPRLPESVDPVDAAALVDFCHALINSNEFVYRN